MPIAALPILDETNVALDLPQTSDVAAVSWDDLELLHHYLTDTYTTLAIRNDLRQMWQVAVPKMGIKHRFMMHSLLSVTALHIASSHPPSHSSYIDRAIRHHNIALQQYSHALRNMTQQNSASLIACSTLIAIVALNLVVLKPHKEASGPVEEIIGIFSLLRGVPVLLEEMWNWVQQSEVSPLFAGRELDDEVILPDDVAQAIKLLEERNRQWSGEISERETYARAIRELENCFKLSWSKNRDSGMVLSWPISVGKEYIALLASRQPMALVILAHYAVALDQIRDTWRAKGWGNNLIQEVYLEVKGDWKSLIAWPVDKSLSR